MRIEGNIEKSGRWWAVEVPLLLVYTQGRTRIEAYAMVREATEDLVEQRDFALTYQRAATRGHFTSPPMMTVP
jgi:hypothetical protein